ncbi:cyclic nucleotide-binding domain protein (macronuclear) [Tetrahymena thermophila SB210]|uniref:Cyclic nucleotide-binding domain protein n=1 Tax=Tetrahymena thermophila (strain SB210) TaxID=312017 RepID=I7M2L3_TETTS|nr:cyclic nucleotide-binding domain protein [Tetrahymena thermophila SB210]EAS00751.1 cyclic nucleotide-binding domain protein [Tetrahymena thermophila SB210]|eukprot:XP_001020996.1 cyclic nucleotide-binding domain protein [Tetrahymena thermophila SB210]
MSQQPNPTDKKQLDMKQVTRILKTPSESRTLKQCTELLEIVGDLQFFKEYNSNPSTANVPKLCCKYMEIEKFNEADIVFEFGSVGNKFYIVLQGSVGVFVKKPQSVLDKEKEEKKDDKKKEAQQDAVVDPLADFMCVKELGDGSAFGELALLNNKPRLATIKTLRETHVATLSKENFNKILKEHEEQKIMKEIQFFEKVPAFKDFNQKQIRYLCLNNKTLETQKNEVIYDEKDPCDCIYVIKEGEFEVYKSVEKQVDQKEEIMKQSILSMSVLNKNSSQKISKQIKIKVLTTGEICGEEFFLNKKQREFKLVCCSLSGIIVKIKINDFLRKLNEDSTMQKAFYKRFQHINEEFQERVQKRIQQFHEYKNFLIQDSIPTKIKMSIEKLYQNNGMSLEQKQTEISEFRQQLVDIENLNKKNEYQQAILSQIAISKRYNQANSLMFQNQVQYLKYKRLNILSESISKTPSARNQTPPEFQQQPQKYDDRRSSFSSATNQLMYDKRLQEALQNKQNSTPQSRNNIPNMHKSMVDFEDMIKTQTKNSNIDQNSQLESLKSQVPTISPQRTNNKTSLIRQQIFRNQAGHQSLDNFQALNKSNSISQNNNNLYQITPLSKNQSINEDKKFNDLLQSPKKQSRELKRVQSSQFQSSNTFSKKQSYLEQINQNDQENSPSSQGGLTKNKSALLNNSKNMLNQISEFDSQKVDNNLYQFNVPNKRLIKYTNPSKDNFIRDWKKNNQVFEDAQQQSLIRKIKKITNQNAKFSDYFKSQIGKSLNDSIGQQTQQLQQNPQTQMQNLNAPKSENTSSTNTSHLPSPLILPKIFEQSPAGTQNNIQNSPKTHFNAGIYYQSENHENAKKVNNFQIQKQIQQKLQYQNNKDVKDKKKSLLIVS